MTLLPVHVHSSHCVSVWFCSDVQLLIIKLVLLPNMLIFLYFIVWYFSVCFFPITGVTWYTGSVYHPWRHLNRKQLYFSWEPMTSLVPQQHILKLCPRHTENIIKNLLCSMGRACASQALCYLTLKTIYPPFSSQNSNDGVGYSRTYDISACAQLL